MKIFIIVGMPASGKNIARMYAQSKGMPYYSTGDIVREEIRTSGLEADAVTTARVSDELRERDGMGVARRALSRALEHHETGVFLEGMRSWQEVELIRQHAPAVVVAFLAPRETRRERVLHRARADDASDAFDERDMREIAYGVAIPIARADAYILNTGSLDDACAALDAIVGTSPGSR
ncbi:MAG: AAA family ATPase [Desulfomonilia bacterium]|nr:AAA family ATPase [Desulfomonilia bacterium]